MAGHREDAVERVVFKSPGVIFVGRRTKFRMPADSVDPVPIWDKYMELINECEEEIRRDGTTLEY